MGEMERYKPSFLIVTELDASVFKFIPIFKKKKQISLILKQSILIANTEKDPGRNYH